MKHNNTYTRAHYRIGRMISAEMPAVFDKLKRSLYGHGEVQYRLHERWAHLQTVRVIDTDTNTTFEAEAWIKANPAPRRARSEPGISRTYWGLGFAGDADLFWEAYDKAKTEYQTL